MSKNYHKTLSSISAPLGFFVLALLIIETLIGIVLATNCANTELVVRGLGWGIGLFVFVVLLVFVLV